MPRQKKVTVSDVESLVDELEGNIGKIAKRLKVSRRTIDRRISESSTLKDKLSDIRESRLDVVEDVLYDKARDGESWAVCFFLKTQGKGRGYTERQEISGKDGNELVFRVVYGTDDKTS